MATLYNTNNPANLHKQIEPVGSLEEFLALESIVDENDGMLIDAHWQGMIRKMRDISGFATYEVHSFHGADKTVIVRWEDLSKKTWAVRIDHPMKDPIAWNSRATDQSPLDDRRVAAPRAKREPSTASPRTVANGADRASRAKQPLPEVGQPGWSGPVSPPRRKPLPPELEAYRVSPLPREVRQAIADQKAYDADPSLWGSYYVPKYTQDGRPLADFERLQIENDNHARALRIMNHAAIASEVGRARICPCGGKFKSNDESRKHCAVCLVTENAPAHTDDELDIDCKIRDFAKACDMHVSTARSLYRKGVLKV